MPKDKATRKSKAKVADTGKKKKDPNAPKRGLSAYLIFSNEMRDIVREEYKRETGNILTFGQVGKEIGARWKALNNEDREPYENKAKADKKRYEDAKASYNANEEEEDED